MSNTERKIEELPEPVGKYIIENAESIQTENGAYYHYSDVCRLLKSYHKTKLGELTDEAIENEIKDTKWHWTPWDSGYRTGFRQCAKWAINKLKGI